MTTRLLIIGHKSNRMNNFAETNEDIVNGMERSAAALAATGTTYQEAFALFTGAQEVLQNAEVGGRALRSISMRIRGYSEDSEDGFEELDEELKNVTGDLINLTKTAQHSQGVSIFEKGSTTEFKSLVDYFGEINAIWDEMSQKQQNDFLQKAFGKTQAQAGAAIIKNYEAVRDSIEAMEESAGSADREMEKIQNSIEYKMNQFKQTWVGMAQDLINRKDFGDLIESLTNASEGLGKSIVVLAPVLKLLGEAAQLVMDIFGGLTSVFQGFTPFIIGAGVAIKKNFGKPKKLVSKNVLKMPNDTRVLMVGHKFTYVAA